MYKKMTSHLAAQNVENCFNNLALQIENAIIDTDNPIDICSRETWYIRLKPTA